MGDQRGERRHAPSPERHRWQLIFLPAPTSRLSLLGLIGWADASLISPRREQRWRCTYRTSENSYDVVVACVSLEAQRDENVGFLGAVDGLGCAKGLRRSRCGCSIGPTPRNGGVSNLNQPTTPHKPACHASATWNTPRPGGQTPKVNSIVSKRRILKFYVKFD